MSISEVTSLCGFLSFVRKGHPDIATFIYRGQPAKRSTPEGREFDSFLVPSLYRLEKGRGSLADLETRLLADFRREAPSHLKTLPATEIEWMAMAQHHGLPTRLLDWTTNPLVALFFAVENTSAVFDAHIYKGKVYDVQIYDYESTTDMGEDDIPFKFYMPTRVDRRLEVQCSCFTLHPLIEFHNQQDFYNHFTVMLPHELNVCKCCIPKSAFGKIKAELQEIGVTYKTLFPGLDGICKTIKYQHTAEMEPLWEDLFDIG